MNILSRKNLVILSLIGFVIVLVLVSYSTSVTAASLGDIAYPVRELGNCTSQQECRAYCDVASNYSICAEFAEKNNLEVQVPDDKKAVFGAIQKGEGPGQCKDEASCRKYCEDIDHIDECLNFVEKFNLSSDELQEIRKVADAKKAGVVFPGNCKTKNSCEVYCQISDHVLECIKFAQKSGIIPKEDIGALEKFIPFIESGGKFPGGCTTKKSCREYCEIKEHLNECADFSVKTGLMSKEEAEIMKKTGGKGPGNCDSKEACDSYCKDEAHIDECLEFGVTNGIISEEEAAMAKKFGLTSEGPSGCKSKAECQSFCAVSENQETCSDWGKERGIDMSGGPGGQAGPGGCKTKEECTAYCKDHQEECQKSFPPSGGAGYSGPGGCKNQEDCKAYCKDHEEECMNFAQPGGGGTGFSGPGGCKTKEECTAYCAANKEDEACKKIMQDSGGPGGQAGPGGCKSQAECQSFCGLKENQETCANFAKENGTGEVGSDSGGADGCAQQGGNWTGSYCDFGARECVKQGGTACDATECAQQGGNWTSHGCDFGAKECTNQGGAWDGSKCNFAPPSPSSFNDILYRSLATILNFTLGR